jgi:IS30 family transposase
MDPSFASPYRSAACETPQPEAPLSVIVLQSPAGQRTHDRSQSHVQTVPENPCIKRGIHTWEGDLISGSGNTHMTRLVERASRFVRLVKVKGKDTNGVVGPLKRPIQSQPEAVMRCLTWHRGTEIARHKQIALATNVDIYICDPQSPLSLLQTATAGQCMATWHK